MSEYGWLAESTMIPKKPGKKIEVDDSSVMIFLKRNSF